ncbi:glycosyl transferase family 2 [Salipaludibacillus neizhouensis]|uniref:Glycosyl transferase family 2 n=1 Tax=Salipaludibacillus neizhouensis TaxID=885475 RepID=A0A3A9K9W7_9BACI|nr:glycosyltransferase [Salipaludibacillus neizhouensis]RKL66433.1 glycosyl transferase family 2 [Salipaludibacillus neizhouensis]
MRPKVSIIVPVFNVEQYLNRCIDSILSQSLFDIEVIAINDGSTDKSSKILHEYQTVDQRVIVIDQTNKGVSAARNKGLQIARGEYIGFVDPDDWIQKDMYAQMYNTAMEQDTDIVMCSYIREFGSHSKEKQFPLSHLESFRGNELNKLMLRRLIGPLEKEISNPEYLDAWGTVWTKLYRSEVIQDNDITFTDLNAIGTNEDSLFNINAFFHAQSFTFIDSPYYHYWRANSSSVTTGYKPNLIIQWNSLYEIIDDFIVTNDLTEEYEKALTNRVCLNTLGLGLNNISRRNNVNVFRKIRQIKSILNNTRLKNSFIDFDIKQFPIHWKLFYCFAKYRFATGFFTMLLVIEGLRKATR